MARYADIDVLLEHLTASDEGNFRTAITQWLEMHQVEDVAPVIHAHWISLKDDSGYYRHCVCSNCAENFGNDVSWLSIGMELPLYCPKCGAKMDEVME